MMHCREIYKKKKKTKQKKPHDINVGLWVAAQQEALHLHRQISFLLCVEIKGGGIDAWARLWGQFQRFLFLFITDAVITAIILFTVDVFIVIVIIIIIVVVIIIIFFVIDWIPVDWTGETLRLWLLMWKCRFFSLGWTPVTDIAVALGPGGDSWRKSVFICSKMLWRRLSSSSFLCS